MRDTITIVGKSGLRKLIAACGSFWDGESYIQLPICGQYAAAWVCLPYLQQRD